MTRCATCPLMTALLPLRYAIGPMEYNGGLFDGLELPGLPGSFPNLERYTNLQDRPIHQIPRLLRDGWLYAWIDNEDRLAEFQVHQGLLTETNRGGDVIDSRSLPFLTVPAGEAVHLAWTPNRWSDSHFNDLSEKADQRATYMRAITPGAAPFSQLLNEELFYGLPEVSAMEELDWSGVIPKVPHWPKLDRDTQRLDQRAVAVVDDPWGMSEDLATLVRLTHANQERLRARYGGEWGLAGTIRELYRSDPQLERTLHELTDLPRLQRTWRVSDESQAHFESVVSGLLDSWIAWMDSLDCADGPASLASACESIDLTKDDHRVILAKKFELSLLGPSYISKGAGAIGRMADLKEEGGLWLWYALLGVRERLSLGDIEKLVELGDVAGDTLGNLPESAAAFAAAVNARVSRLNFHSPAPPSEGLFAAMSPAASAALREFPDHVSALGSGFLVAALARTGQQLGTENVSSLKANQWLSEAANGKPARFTPVPEATARPIPVFRTKAANAPNFLRDNPYTLREGGLSKAPLRSVLVVLTSLNLLQSTSQLLEKQGLEEWSKSVGGVSAIAAAYNSLQHKLAELNWREGLSKADNPEAHSYKIGGRAAIFASLTATLDIVIFGLSAVESYNSGDFDTAAIETGLVGISAGQLAVGVTAFRAYREARAVALGLEAASAVRGLSRLGGWFTALSLGLTASFVGGLVARYYAENTPLERWIANTRFGTMPADWAGQYTEEMERLYKVVFPVKLKLEKVPRLNPYTGTHVQDCWLLLDLPGQARMTEGMIHFEGNELRSGRIHRSLAWLEDQLSKLSSDEEREHLLQPERRPVTWNSSDFSLHEGTRIKGKVGTATYRRIYHGDDRIMGLEGELTYQPQPGLEMPPIRISVW